MEYLIFLWFSLYFPEWFCKNKNIMGNHFLQRKSCTFFILYQEYIFFLYFKLTWKSQKIDYSYFLFATDRWYWKDFPIYSDIEGNLCVEGDMQYYNFLIRAVLCSGAFLNKFNLVEKKGILVSLESFLKYLCIPRAK